jgi:hypothetical protein
MSTPPSPRSSCRTGTESPGSCGSTRGRWSVAGGGSPGGAPPAPGEGGPSGSSHRASVNHRCMVRTLGTVAGSPAWRSRSSRITTLGRSPRAYRRSASRRRSGHEYDPGRRAAGGSARTRARWPRSARCRAALMHPAASQTPERLTTRSLPARRVRNSRDRCSAQSHTLRPKGRWNRARGPDPGPMHIAQGGEDPIPRAL